MFDAMTGPAADPLGDVWWDVARRPPDPDDVEILDETAPPEAGTTGRHTTAAGVTGAEVTGAEVTGAEVTGADWAAGGWAQWADAPPGAVLAALVEDATTDGRVAELDDDAVVAVATAAQRLLGWVMGAQLQAVGELGRRWEATPLGERAAVAELALACGVSQYALSQRMDAALVLPYRLPQVWAALVAGRLEWAKAWEILHGTLVLSDAHAALVEGGALDVALTSNLPDLRAHLARAVLAVDPDGAAERAKDAHARRGVTVRPGPDCTATLALTASSAAVAAAEAALNRLTVAALQAEPDLTGSPSDAGDAVPPRCPEVTRADVLLDLIHSADAELAGQCQSAAGDPCADDDDAAGGPSSAGRAAGSRYARGQVVVTVPLSTLLGLDEHPGALAGYGPVTAGMARELVAGVTRHGTWRCAVTDDRPGRSHGTLLALGRPTTGPGYVPSTAVRDFVVLRDGICRFPGCRQAATGPRTDLDHRVPWRPGASGGVTCSCNLQALCRGHHRLKHEARFAVEPADDGDSLTWTTPTGRVYEAPPWQLPHARLPVDPDPPPF